MTTTRRTAMAAMALPAATASSNNPAAAAAAFAQSVSPPSGAAVVPITINNANNANNMEAAAIDSHNQNIIASHPLKAYLPPNQAANPAAPSNNPGSANNTNNMMFAGQLPLNMSAMMGMPMPPGMPMNFMAANFMNGGPNLASPQQPPSHMPALNSGRRSNSSSNLINNNSTTAAVVGLPMDGSNGHGSGNGHNSVPTNHSTSAPSNVIMATVINPGSAHSSPLHRALPTAHHPHSSSHSHVSYSSHSSSVSKSHPLMATVIDEAALASLNKSHGYRYGTAQPAKAFAGQKVVLATIIPGSLPLKATQAILATNLDTASTGSSGGRSNRNRKRTMKAASLTHSSSTGSSRARLNNPDPLDDVDEGASVTRCICGSVEDDGFMICCEGCGAWQHGDCIGLDENAVPDEYMCDLCEPDGPIHQARREAQEAAAAAVADGDTSGKRKRRKRSHMSLGKKKGRRHSHGNQHGGSSGSRRRHDYDDGASQSSRGSSRSGSGSDNDEDQQDEDEMMEDGVAPSPRDDGSVEGQLLDVSMSPNAATTTLNGAAAGGANGDPGSPFSMQSPRYRHRPAARNLHPLEVDDSTEGGIQSLNSARNSTSSRGTRSARREAAKNSATGSPTSSAAAAVAASPGGTLTVTREASQSDDVMFSPGGTALAANNPNLQSPSPSAQGNDPQTPAASPTGETKLRSLIFTMEQLAGGNNAALAMGMTSPISASAGLSLSQLAQSHAKYSYPPSGTTPTTTTSPTLPSSAASSPVPGVDQREQIVPSPMGLIRQVSENTANAANSILTMTAMAPVSAVSADSSSTVVVAQSNITNPGSSHVVLQSFSPVLPTRFGVTAAGIDGHQPLPPPSPMTPLVGVNVQRAQSEQLGAAGFDANGLPENALSLKTGGLTIPAAAAAHPGQGLSISTLPSPTGTGPSPSPTSASLLRSGMMSPNTHAAVTALTDGIGMALQREQMKAAAAAAAAATAK